MSAEQRVVCLDAATFKQVRERLIDIASASDETALDCANCDYTAVFSRSALAALDAAAATPSQRVVEAVAEPFERMLNSNGLTLLRVSMEPTPYHARHETVYVHDDGSGMTIYGTDEHGVAGAGTLVMPRHGAIALAQTILAAIEGRDGVADE